MIAPVSFNASEGPAGAVRRGCMLLGVNALRGLIWVRTRQPRDQPRVCFRTVRRRNAKGGLSPELDIVANRELQGFMRPAGLRRD